MIPHTEPTTTTGPVADFPPLPDTSRHDPAQWAPMMRSLARLLDVPASEADVLAFEASTYLARHTRGQIP